MPHVLALLLAILPATRAEDEPVPDFRGGHKLARAGVYTTTIGLGTAAVGTLVLVGGLASGDEGLTAVGILTVPQGAAGALVGIPLLDVGALRASRAIEAAGGTISQTPGHLAYGMYGGAVALGVLGFTDRWWFDERAGRWAPVVGGLLVGSFAGACVQHRLAVRQGAALGLSPGGSAPPPAAELPDFWIRVVPTPVGGRAGVVLTGGF